MSSTLIGSAVAPGDTILELPDTGVFKIGNGLLRDKQELRCSAPGTLIQQDDQKHLVIGTSKRYSPVVGDIVIGYVTGVFAEEFKVDIHGPCTACLPILAFENATKRNRPQLSPGDVVYARVAETSRDMDPELTCVPDLGKATGLLGVLESGYVLETDSRHSARLSDNTPPELVAMGSSLAFEIAVGRNGRVWIHSQAPKVTSVVVQALRMCQRLGAAESRQVVEDLLLKHTAK